MAKSIDTVDLGKALAQMMAFYQEDLVAKLDAVGEKHINRLVKITKKTAPKRSGYYRSSITYKKHTADWQEPSTFEWGVEAPAYRLTHLLVNGHQTVHGDRVPGDPFLENALDVVLPEYEKEVVEALND